MMLGTDLDKITDPVEREATIGIIHNCNVHVLFLGRCSDGFGSWPNSTEVV